MFSSRGRQINSTPPMLLVLLARAPPSHVLSMFLTMIANKNHANFNFYETALQAICFTV